MSSNRFTIRKAPNKDGKHSIILSLVKNRKNTSVSTAYSCNFDDWSFETNMLKTNKKGSELKKIIEINNFIGKINLKIEEFIRQNRTLELDFSLEDLKNEVKSNDKKANSNDYFRFHQEIINEFITSNKTGSAKINKETLSSIKKFHSKENLKFSELNYEFIVKYDSFLRSRGGTDSGIGIKMRTIRAIFNKAIDRKHIPKHIYPFELYKVSALKKEAKREYLTADELKALENEDFSANKKQQFARDMYMFSYYCRGMNFIDMMKLNSSNLFEGKISYLRNKTGVSLEFEVPKPAIKILEHYNKQSYNKYLFPLLLSEKMTNQQIENRGHKKLGEINVALKEIMAHLEINKRITFYTARHTFATLLKFKNISIDFIGQSLGHSDIKTTQTYLNKLPSQKLDLIIQDAFDGF
ncbi:site-specific integrase [Flavobacterium columnare]|uniref:site-specific integrase n=1 Tax=Flavobacterium columnare TaxID=996 RepID=UPI002D2087EA|nr:site-specific integrase [Flavobacterium columnare]MEB3801749.1 site-specific integrase [Flavobacterium columnare]